MLNNWTISCHECGNNHATIMFPQGRNSPPQMLCSCGEIEPIMPDIVKGKHMTTLAEAEAWVGRIRQKEPSNGTVLDSS